MIDYGRDYSYSGGEMMFATLYDLVGQDQFNRIVGGYYQQYAGGGTTRDFVAFAKKASSRSLDACFDDWMFTARLVDVVRGATSIGDVAAQYRV